jgi:hypothetical protein
LVKREMNIKEKRKKKRKRKEEKITALQRCSASGI